MILTTRHTIFPLLELIYFLFWTCWLGGFPLELIAAKRVAASSSLKLNWWSLEVTAVAAVAEVTAVIAATSAAFIFGVFFCEAAKTAFASLLTFVCCLDGAVEGGAALRRVPKPSHQASLNTSCSLMLVYVCCPLLVDDKKKYCTWPSTSAEHMFSTRNKVLSSTSKNKDPQNCHKSFTSSMSQLRCNTEKSRAKPGSPHESPSVGGGSFEDGFLLLFFCLDGLIALLGIPIPIKNASFHWCCVLYVVQTQKVEQGK